MPAEKRIENELTVIEKLDEIVLTLVQEGCKVHLGADLIEWLFPCTNMTYDEASELTVMGYFFSENMLGQVVFLIVEQIVQASL